MDAGLWEAFIIFVVVWLVLKAILSLFDSPAPPMVPWYKSQAYRDEFSRNRRIVLAMHGRRCAVCGKAAYPGAPLHVHHIIPRARGGSNDPSNLVPLCPQCHALAHRRLHR